MSNTPYFPIGFPGQYYDQETDLHYNYFRYYNPTTGRYLTPDPIGLEGGINLFVYVRNNPINFIDLYGFQADGDKCGRATRTCVGIARFSAVGSEQATGTGALSCFGVNPNLNTVAVSPAIFGLPFPEGKNLTAAQIAQREQSQRILAQAASQIMITPIGLNLQGGPIPPYTIGDIGDVNIRRSQIPRFDIYRFPTLEAARKFGVQNVKTTITVPATMQCPPGFQEQR